MTNETLINLTIPFLKPSDNVRLALELFNEYKVSSLPVVDGGRFIGYLSEDILIDESGNKKISQLFLNNEHVVAHSDLHYFESLKQMQIHGLECIAIIDSDENFKGVVTLKDIALYISNMGFVASPGGILVLSVINANYSITEISRIVESNDMKILCFYIEDNKEDGFESFITLKLNKTDLSRLIASFERFGYKIEADYHESVFQPIETERLDMLMKYLSI